MNGAVILNAYLNGPKFREPAQMMTDAAERAGIGMRTFLNTDLSVPIGDEKAFRRILGDTDFIIFWDKDIRLARNLEICGYPVFNCSECIRICDDKSLTHLRLEEYGIPSIRTICSPMSFGGDYGDWLHTVKEQIGYPMVVKDCFGSFGEQVRLIADDEGLMAENRGPKIFQEYIECGSRDVRIEVIGGRAAAAAERTAAEGDFRSNASIGGKMSPYMPSEEETMLAAEAAEAVQADFAGVDIIRTDDGPVVCEVNSNAHIRNLRDCTGIDVSDAIIDHIVRLIG